MASDLSSEERLIEKKAQESVEYILFCVLADRKAIVRKSDLNKNILKEHSRLFKSTLTLVEKYLDNVFGLKLVELDGEKGEKFGVQSKFEYDHELNKKDNKAIWAENSSTNRSFYQSGGAGTSIDLEADYELHEQIKYSILIISLAIIFMNENEMDADLFWESMKRIDVLRDEKKHKYLGDVFKYFTVEMVKEGYLEYEKMPGVEPPVYKFKWGYRSKLEISKKSLLNFVCEMYGGLDACKPEEWIAQYADVLKEDNQMEANQTDESNTTATNANATARHTQRTQTQAANQTRSNAFNLFDDESTPTQQPRQSTRLRK